MKKTIRILAVLLATAILFGSMQIGFAAYAANEQEIFYGIENGEAYVSCQPTWVVGDVVIADTYEGYPVTGFSEPSYAYIFCENVTSITIPNSIDADRLTGYPFCGCPSAKIIISDDNPGLCLEGNVLYNKDKTRLIRYQDNHNSKSFTIPESVTEVAESAFSYSNLEELTISNSKVKITYNYGFSGHNIKNIYYYGTEEEWNADYDNVLFQGEATIHFMKNDSSDSADTPVVAPSFDMSEFFTTFFSAVSETVVPFIMEFINLFAEIISILIK